MSHEHPASPPRIADRLRGRHLLVTGSTGLLAKVFVEKILRSVPDVGCIYLLVRHRPDGTSSQVRLRKEVLGSAVFGRLRSLLGSHFDRLCEEKIRVVAGDLTLDRLGLCDDDYNLITRRVEIIVNSAATVTFDERLDIALALNANGPMRLLELARACNSAPYLQVSTCYVSGKREGDIPEILHGAPGGESFNIDAVLAEMRQSCDHLLAQPDASRETGRKKLVDAGMELAHRHGWNDTYTFTKWLGEQQISRARGNVPVVILRPAIIESSHEEPVPGWIDGLRMADPMIIAYGRGKLTDFPGRREVPIDIIPVDLVANAMIAALQDPGTPPGVQVYQVCSSGRNAMTVGQLVDFLTEGIQRRPILDEDGRPIRTGAFTLIPREQFQRKWDRKLRRALKYRDWLTTLNASNARKRQLGSTIAQMEQLIYYAKIYAPYTHLNCRFLDDRLRALHRDLHPDDQKEFPCSADGIDWHDYIVNRHIPGLRKFVLGSARASQHPIPMPRGERLDDAALRKSIHQAATIFEAFEQTAKLCGEKPALQISRRGRWLRYTYEEALFATATITRRFADYGLRPGDRIALCAENGPEWGLVYLAAMRAGLTAIPLDPQLTGDDILGCSSFADAKLLCTGATTIKKIQAAHRHAAEPLRESLLVVDITKGLVPPPSVSRDPGLPPVHVSPDQTASILFTSGTTLAPKAVQLTHANLLANARAIVKLQSLGAPDNFLSVLPLYHAFEFTGGFLIPLTAGSTVTYVEQLKGPDILEAMQSTGTTVMLVVPRFLKLFHDSIRRKVREAGPLAQNAFRAAYFLSGLSGGRLGRILFRSIHKQFGGKLRLFVSGASALDPEIHAFFMRLGFNVAEGYGLTETAPVLTVNPAGACKPGSAGKALPDVRLEIRDPNQAGVGELWAAGPNIMKGYLNDPAATAEVLREGWFRTGDLCRFDHQGYIYITGRVKDIIVSDSGKNVYPDEVEARYKDLPSIKEFCVLGVPNRGGLGESVQAVIVPDYDANGGLDASSVERIIRDAIEDIGRNIPSHQRIQTLHFWRTELPKTSTLKAKRGVIRARLLQGEHPAGRGPIGASLDASALTPNQRLVAGIVARWSHHPVESVSPDSNLLLDLAVDSLMKLSLIQELESVFDFRCTDEAAAGVTRVRDLFALVGDRKPSQAATRDPRAWLARLTRPAAGEESEANGRAESNGALRVPLLPMRWAARGGMSLFFKTYVRVRAEGLDNIPRKGGIIFAANHASHLDSASILTAVGPRRRIWIAGAQDYFFNTRLKSFFFGAIFDTIPFDRQSEGIQGMRRCIQMLRKGEAVLFFPEGTRSTTGKMAAFKIGVALMATEGRAAVIPTRIDHAYDLLPKGRTLVRPGEVRVTFGSPLPPDPYSGIAELEEQYRLYHEYTQAIQSRIESLASASRRPERRA